MGRPDRWGWGVMGLAAAFFAWQMWGPRPLSLVAQRQPKVVRASLRVDSLVQQDGSVVRLIGATRPTVLYLFLTTCRYCQAVREEVEHSLGAAVGVDVYTASREPDSLLQTYWSTPLRVLSVDTAQTPVVRSVVPALALIEPDGRIARRWLGADSIQIGLTVLDSIGQAVGRRPVQEIAREVVAEQEAWYGTHGTYAPIMDSLPLNAHVVARLAATTLTSGSRRGYAFQLKERASRGSCIVGVGPTGPPSGVECTQ